MGVIRKAVIVGLIAVAIYFCNKYIDGCTCDPSHRIDGKVVIITGANSGMGKASTENLALRGGKIYMACRTVEKGQKVADDIVARNPGLDKNNLIVLKLDLSSTKSIREFVQEFSKREKKLDILMNNAAAHLLPTGSTTADGFEATIGINYIGPFLLTTLLTERLIAGAPSRVVLVTADRMGMGTERILVDDLENKKDTMSWMTKEVHAKQCADSFTFEFGRRLRDSGVNVYAAHPGQIFTDGTIIIFKYQFITDLVMAISPYFMKSPMDGAQTQVYCAVEPKLANTSGKFYIDCEEAETDPTTLDEEVAVQLWDVTMDMLKLESKDLHPKLRK